MKNRHSRKLWKPPPSYRYRGKKVPQIRLAWAALLSVTALFLLYIGLLAA